MSQDSRLDGVDYNQAPPLTHDEPDFSVRVDNGIAWVDMIAHFPTADEARAIVDPFMKAWALHVELNVGHDMLDFEYLKPIIVDRQPPPGTLRGIGVVAFGTVGQPTLHTSLSDYPGPSSGLGWNPDIEAMYDRLKMYRRGETTLLDASNFCLTTLEGPKKKHRRKAAASKFGIQIEILDCIGKWSAEKGGGIARKHQGAAHPLSAAEVDWLEMVLPMLIRRAAEVAYDPSAANHQIKLSDLPPV